MLIHHIVTLIKQPFLFKTFAAYFQNAVVALNELRPGLEYRLVEQKGPTHLPLFVMQIEVNGHVFNAEGR